MIPSTLYSLARRKMSSIRPSFGAVSYTHLDVYKRQEEERAGGLDMIYELMRMLGCEKTETVRDSYLSMLEKRGV